MADGSAIRMPSLGRNVQLGNLYDCRSEKFIPGHPLWDEDLLQKYRHVESKNETQNDVITNDSLDTKCSALGVDMSLKASYLSGLVEVKGSGKYLNDRKTSGRQTRLVLQYKTLTRFEALKISHLKEQDMQRPDVFEQSLATHVVTGITFGAQAFFVFDRYLNDNEDKKDIEGEMKDMIDRIRNQDLTGADRDAKKTKVMNCNFYGDFCLEHKPKNYKEAWNIYQELPLLIGKDGEHAVPMIVWLYPLEKLDSSATKLVQEVRSDLISSSEYILEGLIQCQIKANDMKDNVICKDFPQFTEKLKLFKKHISDYSLTFQRKLASFLPRIRGGVDECQTLADCLAEFDRSPFCLPRLESWLKRTEREMARVLAFMKDFASIRVISSRDTLDDLLVSLDIKKILCFSFPLVGHADEYLERMSLCTTSPFAETGTFQKGWFDDVALLKKIRVKANQFKEFASANHESRDTIFTVMCLDDGDTEANVGGTMFLYTQGELTTKDYEPPGSPGIPVVSKTTHDTACVAWDPPRAGESTVESYILRYRDAKAGIEEWNELNTKSKTAEYTISGLYPNVSYEFSVAAVCDIGVGKSSSVSEIRKTLPASPPSGLRKHASSERSITVEWDVPMSIGKNVLVEKYQIKYKVLDDRESEHFLDRKAEGSICLAMISNLKPGTYYRISLCAVCKPDGQTAFSDSIDIATKSELSVAQEIKKKSTLIKVNASQDELPAYKLPLSEVEIHSGDMYRMYAFGKGKTGTEHRVIMIVGATGAGKSTLINGMINYIIGVEWEDPFRFKMIAEEGENQSGTQAVSQTQYITSYTIHQNAKQNLKYTLTIIDTPGFGDTRGIEKDKLIVEQIRNFFKNSSEHHIDHINAIGFVAQSSQSRLTHTQKYVFDSILSIFGKDIADNIMLLVTFADGKKAPVMDAIKAAEIPCSNNVFKFNNSALFARNVIEFSSQDEGNFDELFWKMNLQSMKKFFSALNKVQGKSLSLTREVLEERENLEVSVANLQEQIQMGCCKLEELRREQRILEENEAKIETNKDFAYVLDVPKSRKIDIKDEYITNCSKCHHSCHYPCYIPDDREKYRCAAMGRKWGFLSKTKCTVCPGKCIWNLHFNQAYGFEYYTDKETRTFSELEKKYNEATGMVLTVKQVIKKHLDEFLNVQQCVFHLISKSHTSIQRLEEIALKPNPLSVVEYVDLLIETEKQEAKPGWSDRVNSLRDIRKEADIYGKVQETDYDPFEKYRKEFLEKQKTGSLWNKFCSFFTREKEEEKQSKKEKNTKPKKE